MAVRFEYKFISHDVKYGREHELESVLNQLGREGWEVVSHAVAGGNHYSVILKRMVG